MRVAGLGPGRASWPVWLGTARGQLALIGVGLAQTVLWWLLWAAAYRLNERFEYADLLLAAWPWVEGLLAAALAAVGSVAPAALASYQGTAGLFVALYLAQFGLYLVGLTLIWGRAPRATGVVLAFTAVWQLVLLPLPGLFTTDLFSYAMYGEIAGRYGGSPYVQTPNDFPANPLYLLINPLWRDAPSVYGPVWIGISGLVGGLLADDVFAQSIAYRLIADASHWLNLGLLGWTLRRLRPGAEPLGLALYAWNPLVVFEFSGNGHNDGTMLIFLLLAVGLVARERAWPGFGALVLSVATKYTTVLLLPVWLWWATRRQATPARLALVALGGTAALALLAILYLPWWRGTATLGPILNWLSTPLYANYAPYGLAVWLRDTLVAAGWGSAEAIENGVLGIQRLLVRVAFLSYLAWEALRLAHASQLPSLSARVFLAFLLGVNTWVLPWYFTWPLAMAALSRPASPTVGVAVGFSLSAPLSMYWAQASFGGLEVGGFAVYLAPLAALAAWQVARRLDPHGAWRSSGRARLTRRAAGWSPPWRRSVTAEAPPRAAADEISTGPPAPPATSSTDGARTTTGSSSH